MLLNALVAFVHHLAAFTLVAALTAQVAVFPDRRVRKIDAVYGASAGALLVIGLVRVFFFDKGVAYYFGSVFFLAKLGLFIAVGLLSIYPTIMFRRLQLSAAQERRVALILRLQLAGVVLILLCAALVAKGAGFRG